MSRIHLEAQRILECSQKQQGELWISGLNFLRNQKNLETKNIKSVCSIMSGKPPVLSSGISHLQIDLEDNQGIQLEQFLDACQKTYTFININLENQRNVLVHCVLGLSRSASICCYYLMKKLNLSYSEASSIISSVRPCIKINRKFINYLLTIQRNNTQRALTKNPNSRL